MRQALARHDPLLRQIIEAHSGHVFKTVGDQCCAAFATAPDALAAALNAQRALQAEPWGEVGRLTVRMALHTGAAQEQDGDYLGPTLSVVARICDAGHGGQILLTQATCELVGGSLPVEVELRDLGQHRLRGLARLERVFQILAPDLPSEFPPSDDPRQPYAAVSHVYGDADLHR
jgi:class 3 adenylate cyclase